MTDNLVSIIHEDGAKYPDKPPFHPPKPYPEYPFPATDIDPDNRVYPMVRDLLFRLGLDKEQFGTEKWNPLTAIVHPGDTVILKPNFILHFNDSGEDLFSVITHGSVIRAILDYVYLALEGKGRIIIADAPNMNADFEEIVRLTGTDAIIDYYREKLSGSSIALDLFDLRKEHVFYKFGIVWKRVPNRSSSKAYLTVDLGEASELKGIDCQKIYGADYNRDETYRAHSRGHHEYCISKEVVEADVLINLPKMKVHRKAGVTLSLKNLVGINSNKNHIIHFTLGSPKESGDETPTYTLGDKIDRKLRDFLLGRIPRLGRYLYVPWFYFALAFNLRPPEKIEKGNWKANDTVWRGVLDINKALFYADKEGKITPHKTKRYLTLVDGIVAGEGEGPLKTHPKTCSSLVGGFNPVAVDLVTTHLMGIDYKKIPLMRQALQIKECPLFSGKPSDIKIKSNVKSLENLLSTSTGYFHFELPEGWQGSIEL